MSIEALKEQARGYEQAEDWGKALQAYVEAINRQGDEDQPDLGLYNRAGDLSTRLGDPIGAIGHYERAVDLYLESELPNNAIAILKKILRNLPDRAEVYLRMGKIRAEQGFLTDARDNFLIYAGHMQQAGNMEEAFRALSEFAELAPEDTDVRLALADQLHAHEKSDEAVAQLFRAYETFASRRDVPGATLVEERILAIDPDAVVPDITDYEEVSSYDAFEQTAHSHADSSDELGGEIAFDGDLDHEDEDHDGLSAGPDEFEAEDVSSPTADMDAVGEIALETDEIELDGEIQLDSGDIEIDEGLDDLAIDENESVQPTAEVSEEDSEEFESDADTSLDDAFIDFDAGADAADVVDENEGAVMDAGSIDTVAETEERPEADHDWDSGAEDEWHRADADEWAAESSEEWSAEDASSDEAEADDLDGELEDATSEWEIDAAADGAATDDDPEGEFGEAVVDSVDDEIEDVIGGDLPLLALGDDAMDGVSGELDEDASVAVEVASDDESAESTFESGDEWIGLDETEPAAADNTDDDIEAAGQEKSDTTWSTGAEFEIESVRFEDLDIVELREYVDANPDSGAATEHLGRKLFASGETEEAAQVFEVAHAVHADGEDFLSAMRSVRELLLIDPDSVAHHQRLVEYAQRGDDRTLLVSAFLELGDCLERTGDPDRSDAVYKKVLEIDPGNRRAQAALGVPASEEEQEDAGAGFIDLGSMVLEKREKTTRWTVEADEPANEDEFDFQNMLSQFRAKVAEHVDADDVQAHYDLGTAYKEMGLLDEAISEFQQALRADGRNLATHELLGQSFMEKGQPEVAIRTLTRAIELPFDVEDELLGIYYYLGRAHEELGNRDDAVEYYEKVFALDINFEDVTERLRSLR